MKSKTVLAVDPGLVSGVAVWCDDGSLTVDQLDGSALWDMVEAEASAQRSGPLTVVCESFVISARTIKASRQTWSLEHIGVLKFLCRKHGCEIVLQQASAAKSVVTNERLKQWGWYRPGRDHANDALRHLGLYLIQRRLIRLE